MQSDILLDIRSVYNSECILSAFQIRAHSCGWPECFAHAQNFRGAFGVEKHRTAFEVYSNCTLTAF